MGLSGLAKTILFLVELKIFLVKSTFSIIFLDIFNYKRKVEVIQIRNNYIARINSLITDSDDNPRPFFFGQSEIYFLEIIHGETNLLAPYLGKTT